MKMLLKLDDVVDSEIIDDFPQQQRAPPAKPIVPIETKLMVGNPTPLPRKKNPRKKKKENTKTSGSMQNSQEKIKRKQIVR
jgi:hypothetical protein